MDEITSRLAPEEQTLARIRVSADVPEVPASAHWPSIPGYEILSEIGRGGMGVVYRAREGAPTNRVVALKSLLVGKQARPELVARFRQEAAAVAALSHEHIVQIYGFGEDQGVPYFTMELIDGGDLAEKLNGTPLAAVAAARLIETLARTMHAVHLQGKLLHRDLKPKNVLLRGGPQAPVECCTPKITDFGLAKLLDTEGNLTPSDGVLGTPSYMAPEQALGRMASKLDVRVDVYALGAILYECLTGRPPYRAPTPVETVVQVLDPQQEPLPPRRLQPALPRDLEVICLKCLQKDSRKRYASALDLADDLRRFLDGEAIHARAVTPVERAVKWVRRHPARTIALSAVVLFLAGLPLGLLLHAQRLQQAFALVDQKRIEAERNEAEARDHGYAADLRLAQQLFKAGDSLRLGDVIDRHQPGVDDADRRGFEWFYLDRHRQKVHPPLHAHDAPVTLVALTPDGRSLVTCGVNSDPSLYVWDYPAGRKRFSSTVQYVGTSPVPQAALSPDGRTLAMIANEREPVVVLWDMSSGREKRRLPFLRPLCVAFSGDNRLIAALGANQDLTIYDVATGEPRPLTFSGAAPRAGGAVPMAFAPDGKSLVYAADAKLQFWSNLTGKPTFVPLTADASCLAFNRSGSMLATATEHVITLWDPTRLAQIAQLVVNKRDSNHITAITISPDDRLLAVGVADGEVRLYDLSSLQIITSLRWQGYRVSSLTFTSDARTLFTGTADGTVYAFDPNPATIHDRLVTPLSASGAIAYSPAGMPGPPLLAVADSNRSVRILDAETLKVQNVLGGHLLGVERVAFLRGPEGSLLASVHQADQRITIWDVKRGEAIQQWHPPVSRMLCLEVSMDGKLLATGHADETIRLHDTSGKECGSFPQASSVTAIALSPDHRLLASGGSDGRIKLWNAKEPAPRSEPLAEVRTDSGIGGLRFAADGRMLYAVEKKTSKVRSWKVENDRFTSTSAPGPDWLPASLFTFSPDGRCLLAISSFNIMCRDITTGDFLWSTHRVLADVSAATGAAWSPDGKHVALTFANGSVELWDMQGTRVRYAQGLPLQGRIRSLTFTPDSSTLFTGTALTDRDSRGYVNAARVLEAARQALTKTSRGQKVPHYDFRLFASSSASIRSWAMADASERDELPQQHLLSTPYLTAVSADGGILALGGRNGAILLWDRKQMRHLPRLFASKKAEEYVKFEAGYQAGIYFMPIYPESSVALSFTADGKTLLSVSSLGTVRAWDAQTWKELTTWQLAGEPHEKSWVTFGPDSTLVTHQENVLQFWNGISGEQKTQMRLSEEIVPTCAAFSRKGDILATATTDHRLHLIELGTGKTRTMLGHLDRVADLAFCPDGKTLASASWDGSVRLWSLASAQEVAAFSGHRGRVLVVAFAPDGATLAAGGEAPDGTSEVLLWRTNR